MNFEQMMAELRLEYLASFPQKIAEINLHLDKQVSEDLRNDFHKLKGTGKTYGLDEVSILGELCEHLCIDKSEKIREFVPIAVEILNEILISRNNNCAYILNNSPKFQKLTNFR